MTLPIWRHRPVEARRGWFRDPVAEFDDLFNRMGSLLESTVTGYGPAERAAWAPLADVTETEDAYIVEAELPGLRREDIDVEVGDRQVAITGELREPERKGTLHRGSRRTGRFEYRATLPGEVNAEAVSASLADGVLTVRLPKAPNAGARHIEIESRG